MLLLAALSLVSGGAGEDIAVVFSRWTIVNMVS